MTEQRDEYLEMCEKAFPDVGVIESGGYISIRAIRNLWALRVSSPGEKLRYAGLAQHVKPEASKEWFQVYRQDQLQERLVDKFGIRDLLFHLYHFAKETEATAWTDSLEQLWLMFLMSEHFDKIWNAQKREWVSLS